MFQRAQFGDDKLPLDSRLCQHLEQMYAVGIHLGGIEQAVGRISKSRFEQRHPYTSNLFHAEMYIAHLYQ